MKEQKDDVLEKSVKGENKITFRQVWSLLGMGLQKLYKRGYLKKVS